MTLADAISLAVQACLKSALSAARGNVTEAAKMLGVHRASFYRMAARHGVKVLRQRQA